MDLGLTLPTSNVPLGTSPQVLARIAQAAERQGYATVWTYERLLMPVGNVEQPGGPPRPLPDVYRLVYDPIESLTFVAATTERIKLGTSVVDALFHVPVVLAKRYATLDQLSGGRAIAGLGQGWMAQEFSAADVSPRRRGAGMDEFVAAMRACWGPDPVRSEGRFYRIPESIINPKPVQPAGPPILLGSMSPGGIERAARIADGFNPIAFSREQLESLVNAFRTAAQAAGRDPARLPIMVRVNQPILAEPVAEERRPYLGGSAEQIALDLEALRPLNLTEVFFVTGYAASVDEEERLMEQLMQAVRTLVA
jgi:probable F420-dependent oxidoreductase